MPNSMILYIIIVKLFGVASDNLVTIKGINYSLQKAVIVHHYFYNNELIVPIGKATQT
jgi:hypothetical protein